MWLPSAIIVAVVLLRVFLRRGAQRRPPAPGGFATVATVRPDGTDVGRPLAVRELDRQSEIIDRLDARIGVVLALTGAATIWLLKDVGTAGYGPLAGRAWRQIGRGPLAEHLAVVLFALGIAALLVAFVLAFAALTSRSAFRPARPGTLAILRRDLHGARQAYEANAELIAVKAGRFHTALWCGAIGVGGVAAGLLVRGLFASS